MHNTSSERSIREKKNSSGHPRSKSHLGLCFPKIHPLGSQNNSRGSRPEKMPKIVNCATIKETKKPKETMVGGPSGIGGYTPTSTWIILGDTFDIW